MMRFARVICFVSLMFVTGAGNCGQILASSSRQAAGGERFEVASIKAVRPTLLKTIAALKKGSIAEAKTDFEDYDSGWNGIEVYINTRDKSLYDELEHTYQSRIEKALNSPNADAAALAADAQAMLAKYDEAISMVEKATPLNPLYDDIARLRIVRANLREVTPAIKGGDVAKARKSFGAFDDKWDSIEDLIKERSADSYTEIEKGMIQIEKALMPDKPDVDQVTMLVKGVMDKYNAVVADITKDARAR